MNTLAIDFAPQSWFRRMHRVSLFAWACCILAILWIFAVLLQNFLLNQHLLVQQQQLAKGMAQIQARGNVKPIVLKTTVTETKAKAVNQAIAKLNLPWHDLLDALEAATPSSIALLSVEPDAPRRLLRASAEAKTSKEMATYLKNLRIAGFFDSVLLTKHEINEADPNRPLRFQFEARWLVGFDTPAENAQDRLDEVRANLAATQGAKP